jgi:hypothetical protein
MDPTYAIDTTQATWQVLAFRMALNQLHALSLCTGQDVEECLAAVSSETPLPSAWADALDKQVSSRPCFLPKQVSSLACFLHKQVCSPSALLPTYCASSICC